MTIEQLPSGWYIAYFQGITFAAINRMKALMGAYMAFVAENHDCHASPEDGCQVCQLISEN